MFQKGWQIIATRSSLSTNSVRNVVAKCLGSRRASKIGISTIIENYTLFTGWDCILFLPILLTLRFGKQTINYCGFFITKKYINMAGNFVAKCLGSWNIRVNMCKISILTSESTSIIYYVWDCNLVVIMFKENLEIITINFSFKINI